MIFIPHPDEAKTIRDIHKIRNSEYALLRLTYTMINKNTLDANGILRALLLTADIVDYDALDNGGENGKAVNALYIQSNKTEAVKLKFYKVQNSRGDRRFSFEAIKKRARDRELNEGDLLYISAVQKPDGTHQIYIINQRDIFQHVPITSRKPVKPDSKGVPGFFAFWGSSRILANPGAS